MSWKFYGNNLIKNHFTSKVFGEISDTNSVKM